MRHLQTVNGATYTYDPESGATFFGQADADDFTYNDGVTYLSACGCRAETGCRCRQKITSLETPTETPLAEINAGVQRAREKMEAERQARANRDHSADPPEPYTLALQRKRHDGTYAQPIAQRQPELRACGVAHDGYCAEETADDRMRRVFRDGRGGNHVKRSLAREVARMAAQVPDPPQPYTIALRRRERS